ncbi:MAG: glutamate synthase subunit beta [Candidatus Nitrohelix vancouverensis]|uniref:Glutamate synthase subunit beta n=1 Tax=Candidatus Nitrohelix vancouverensis TaxID=2705534 RepID=A0A7T0C493_9BACT|nr:MAG: glutamate synthase subunit beta [Candidatus Nitrohelix vancouverensis]
MGAIKGFLEFPRETPPHRDVAERLVDHLEVYEPFPEDKFRQQGARCMDCGVPFCQSDSGCPLGNMIPDWNDMVYRGQWEEAVNLLLKTNNFPEFTGRICPAPCEGACVLGITEPPVTICKIEQKISDKGFEDGYIQARPPEKRTGKKVAVVGSGPAGLACAAQLNSVGHTVTVLEKDDRVGGLLMYGIPHFKLEKEIVKRRIRLMEEEGVVFKTGVHVGVDVKMSELRKDYDAVVLCGGAQKPRDLPVEGRDLDGVHFAMEFLPQQNKRNEGDTIPEDIAITAKGKNVLIIGGGDTGSDCLGTSLRQGAKSVHQFELLPQPPEERAENNPWPQWPRIFRVTSSHEEAQDNITDFCVSTKKFIGENGKLKKIQAVRIQFGAPDPKTGRPVMEEVPGSEFEMDVELVLLAMGFVHPVHEGMIQELDVKLDGRGNVEADTNKMTSVNGVFVAGDMSRGQSLVVWAIAEGREAARGVDLFLMGKTDLPHSEFLT